MPKSNFAQSVLVNDPTTVINTLPDSTTHNGQGLWSQLQSAGSIFDSSISNDTESRLHVLEKQVEAQALTIKLMRLKLLVIEGTFTQEEIANIRKMIMSEDEAARTLANSIIENA